MTSAVAWARVLVRRHHAATVGLVLLIGLGSGLVGAAVAAGRRSESSLARFDTFNGHFDAGVLSCPPGVDPNLFTSQQEFAAACFTEEIVADNVATISGLDGVIEASRSSFLVAGILDATAPNGWGRVAGIQSVESSVRFSDGIPLLLAGRMPDAGAADEALITETTSRQGAFAVGDTISVASWSPDELDLGVSGALPPTTEAVSLRVVGVGRFRSDLAPAKEGDVSRNFVDGDLQVLGATGPELRGFASYGVATAVRLTDGAAGVGPVRAELDGLWTDRLFTVDSSNIDAGSFDSVANVVSIERTVVFGLAAIAALAVAGFVALTLVRQLRTEQADGPVLAALGMTSRERRAAALIRSAAIAVPAALVAVATMIALSPLTPIGVARRAEPHLGVFFDGTVAALVAAVIVVMVGLTSLMAPSMTRTPAEATASRPGTARRSEVFASLGPVARAGVEMARGSWPLVAAGVSAIAIGALVTAVVLVTSFARVVDEPDRFGAWWDVSAGNYSEADALESGAASLADDPDVETVVGLVDQTDVIQVNGEALTISAYVPFKGHASPVLTEGRAPASVDEIALGKESIERLGVRIGDTVSITPSSGDFETLDLEVTGTFLNNNPVSLSEPAGVGAFLTPDLVDRLTPGVAQIVLVKFRDGADRDKVINRLAATFDGELVPAQPGDDVRNLERLRGAPWAVAGLVSVLAGASLAHALVTTVRRRRKDLAVLVVLGLERRRARRVMSWATTIVIAKAALIGAPLGLVAGSQLWGLVRDRLGIDSGPVRPAPAIAAFVAIAVVGALMVTAISTARNLRFRVATILSDSPTASISYER